MNFKNFKKVHEDDDKAVLKNEMGHSITIAKKSLSKQHAKGLKDLPLYQADPDDEVTAPDAPAEQPDRAPAQAPDTDAQPDPGTPGTPGTPAQSPQPQTGIPQAPGQTMVQDAQQQAQGYAPVNATQQQAQEYQTEAVKFAQDIASGHITPETYHSLFAKKDTLGKIGTLFGLMVGGAGAGLTHSANPVLSMMDKQIANDLEAQKTSKVNAQNFLRLNQANELLKADIPNKVATGKLIGAQTQQATAAAKIDADTHVINQMKIAKLASIMGLVSKLPPGSPQAPAAQQALQQVEAHTMQSIQQNSQAAAQQKAAIKQFSNDQQANMLLGMPDIAADNNSKMVPGFGKAGKPVDKDVQTELKNRLDLEKAAQEYVQFATDNQGNWANLNAQQRLDVEQRGANMAKALQDKYGTAHGKNSAGERGELNKIIPDTPVSFLARFNQIPKVQEIIHSNRMAADTTAQQAMLPDRPWNSNEPAAPKRSAPKQTSEERWKDNKTQRDFIVDSKTKKFLRWAP